MSGAPQQENLRQAGHNRSGSVRRGRPTKQAVGSVPFSSIPCKYEGFSERPRSEDKAFNSKSSRFGPQKDEQRPGPGEYFQPVSLVREGHSLSKKGYGSMVSCNTRWKQEKLAWTGPGPGEYKDKRPANDVGAFNRASATANFHGKTTFMGLERSEVDVPCPGPGSYNHMASHHNSAAVKWIDCPHTGQTSAFKASQRKLELAGCKEAPPPGRYQLGKDWHRAEAQHTQFKKHSAREAPVSSSAGPPAVIFAGSDAAGAQQHMPRGGPGPGAYAVQESISIERSAADKRAKHSPAFAATAADRFGLTPTTGDRAPRAPGPGSYNSPQGACERKTGASSAFVSTASKSALLDEKVFRDLPPGPAYYNPKNSGHAKVSTHLNARRRFLSAV